MFKSIPIPKLMVPTGLDEQGRPTGLLFWGRAVPSEQIDNASFAKTFDLSFLYQVKTLVDLIHQDASLSRAHASIVEDLFQGLDDQQTLLV